MLPRHVLASLLLGLGLLARIQCIVLQPGTFAAADEESLLDSVRESLTSKDLEQGKALLSQLRGPSNNPEAVLNYTLGIKAYERQLQDGLLDGVAVLYPPPFACPVFTSSAVPTSVHKLRASDIRVVAAIGDSLTAAFGADSSTIVDVREYRGLSWSIGGDGNVGNTVTLPNIVRAYSSRVAGYSLGIGSGQKGLNVAVSGAVAQDTAGQATELVRLLRERADYSGEWKIVTLFIGGNNLCRVCKDPAQDSPSVFASSVRATLDILTQVPRMLVNLVGVIDVAKLKAVEGSGFLGCAAVHQAVCACGTSNDANVRAQVSRTCADYNVLLRELAADPRYLRDDFAVAYQPMYENTQIPRDSAGRPIREYFAPDCFHFAAVTHQGVAVTLWNNMHKPAASKPDAWVPGQQFVCPASTDYICTPRNENPREARCNL